MPDYILPMHNDAAAPVSIEAWAPFIAGFQAANRLLGGSAIGPGICVRKMASAPEITAQISGFMRVTADSLEGAEILVAGNHSSRLAVRWRSENFSVPNSQRLQ